MIQYEEHKRQQNQMRVNEQEKLFHYYHNRHDKILSYLESALSITFNSDDINELQKHYINITTKITDQLSVVYRDPAIREIISKDKTNQEVTEYYNALIPQINTADKTAHRYAKLVNVSLTRVLFDGGIKYRVLPSWLFNVECDEENPYVIKALSYDKYFKNDKNEDELFRVVWTDTEHYKVPYLSVGQIKTVGDRKAIKGNEQMINPYGKIPYAVLRLKEQGDFWGSGLSDVVNGNEQINLVLTELINEHILMGAAGTLLAVNLDLKEKNEKGDYVNKKVRTGRKHPIEVRNAKTDEVPPSLSYVNTDPKINDLKGWIDWQIKMTAMSHGINPNSFLAEVQATSGYSKILDSLEQNEIRRDDIEPCRAFEDERFDITRRVNNYHATKAEGKGLKQIPDDAELKVDFAEIKAPLTPEEQRAQDDWDLAHNLTNLVKIAQRNNPDLSEEEIKKMLLENQEMKKLFTEEQTNGTTPPKGAEQDLNNQNASEEASSEEQNV